MSAQRHPWEPPEKKEEKTLAERVADVVAKETGYDPEPTDNDHPKRQWVDFQKEPQANALETALKEESAVVSRVNSSSPTEGTRIWFAEVDYKRGFVSRTNK